MPRPEHHEPEAPEIDVRDLALDQTSRDELLRLAERAVLYAQSKREATKLLDGASEKIKKLLALSDCGKAKVMAGSIPLNYYSLERRTLKPELLLANGVTPKIIAKCTTVTTAWALRVGAEE